MSTRTKFPPRSCPARPSTPLGSAAVGGLNGALMLAHSGRSVVVPGVWMAGNGTDLTAQVGASVAAAGTPAGAHINADLTTADAEAAPAARRAA